jgi:hypothetical protein
MLRREKIMEEIMTGRPWPVGKLNSAPITGGPYAALETPQQGSRARNVRSEAACAGGHDFLSRGKSSATGEIIPLEKGIL